MAKLEIHALSELREQAARLLADRYAKQRQAEPLLPDAGDLDALLPAGDGLAATRGGDAVAYLAGEVDGDIARVGFAGCAASEAEALRDLFAALAERWGVSRFAVAVPASDRTLLDAWFRLAFGCQFVWAVREVDTAEPVDFGGTIRPSSLEDVDAVISLDHVLTRLQARSPSFSGLTPHSSEELTRELQEVWDQPETYTHFVAERDSRIVGHAMLYRRPEGDLRVPAHNIDLAQAVTLEEAQGSGVGLALTHHVLNWAAERAYRSMTVDWRSVNLLSSRFWPRRGFRPQYLRLYRAVP